MRNYVNDAITTLVKQTRAVSTRDITNLNIKQNMARWVEILAILLNGYGLWIVVQVLWRNMAVLFEAVLALLAVYGLWNVVQVLLRYFASSETQAPHTVYTRTPDIATSEALDGRQADSTTVYTRTPNITTREALDERQADSTTVYTRTPDIATREALDERQAEVYRPKRQVAGRKRPAGTPSRPRTERKKKKPVRFVDDDNHHDNQVPDEPSTRPSRAPMASPQIPPSVEPASNEPERQRVPALRVVLLGTTGTGKSATGNTLLGDKIFLSSPRRTSVTGECSVAEVDRFGTRLVVVDTPGVLDTGMSDEDIEVMLKECTHLACPGVHAFLFLMKIGDRDIEGKDKKTFDLITKMFGEEFLDYTIVVFTAKECLGDEETLDQYVSDLPAECKAFINSCKGGYLAISNVAELEEATVQVVEKIKDFVQKNGERYYKNILFDKENEELRKEMEHFLNTENMTDRKQAKLLASRRLKLKKKIKKAKNIMTGVAVVGGSVAAVATGGVAAAAVAGGTAAVDIAVTALIVGSTFGSAVGASVKGISSVIISKIRWSD